MKFLFQVQKKSSVRGGSTVLQGVPEPVILINCERTNASTAAYSQTISAAASLKRGMKGNAGIQTLLSGTLLGEGFVHAVAQARLRTCALPAFLPLPMVLPPGSLPAPIGHGACSKRLDDPLICQRLWLRLRCARGA